MDYETTKRFTKDKDFWLEKLENFEDNILLRRQHWIVQLVRE